MSPSRREAVRQVRAAIEVLLLNHAHEVGGDDADPDMGELAYAYEALTGWAGWRGEAVETRAAAVRRMPRVAMYPRAGTWERPDGAARVAVVLTAGRGTAGLFAAAQAAAVGVLTGLSSKDALDVSHETGESKSAVWSFPGGDAPLVANIETRERCVDRSRRWVAFYGRGISGVRSHIVDYPRSWDGFATVVTTFGGWPVSGSRRYVRAVM